MSDNITIQLDREDAAALIYILDPLIEQQSGSALGSLFRGLQTELIGAFGGTRPPSPIQD